MIHVSICYFLFYIQYNLPISIFSSFFLSNLTKLHQIYYPPFFVELIHNWTDKIVEPSSRSFGLFGKNTSSIDCELCKGWIGPKLNPKDILHISREVHYFAPCYALLYPCWFSPAFSQILQDFHFIFYFFILHKKKEIC